jgi:Tol biopolymer transport system component
VRAATLRWLAVIAVGTAALGVVLYFASTVDRRPPQVTSYELTQRLVADAGIALTTTSVEVTFNEPVEHETAEAAFEIDPAVPGAFSWSGTTMIFTPQERLPLETEFTVRIQPGVRDLAGNAMPSAAAAFNFVTVGRPSVVATIPGDGAEEVTLDSTITVTFSTLMDTASIEQALRIDPQIRHRLQWNGEQLEIVPARPLEPGRAYRVEIDTRATDQDGVELAEPLALSFETVPPGLMTVSLVPRDGSEGIAVTTQLGIVFDRPVDPDTLDEGAFTVTPEVAGSFELVDGDDGPRLLRFTPSAPLPPNTTFSAELVPGLRGADGRQLAQPVSWTFTTGAPLTVLGNHVVFLSERAGVTNLWAMNFDGTGQRQLSIEMTPVLDYAVSPDGRTFVVGDGFRLIEYRADGAARRVLTDPAHLEFDPYYAPDGSQLAFARADADSGEPLGLWERPVDGGDPTPVLLPQEFRPGASPPADEAPRLLRAPVYSPDWSALAFVDVTEGRIGILELPRERLTSASLLALSPPSWHADSTAVVLAGVRQPGAGGTNVVDPAEPVRPLRADLAETDGAIAVRLQRGATAVVSLGVDGHIVRVASGPTGRLAYLAVEDPGQPEAGRLGIIEADGEVLDPLPDADDVAWMTFGAEPATMVVERQGAGIWLVTMDGSEPLRLAREGSRPRWLP